ncbi:MAG: hypothetical protein Q8M31_14095 [Beijerinckiaceae bacterium]|nr:hypothetical protein [Beijerinckiaceae bacterium]
MAISANTPKQKTVEETSSRTRGLYSKQFDQSRDGTHVFREAYL